MPCWSPAASAARYSLVGPSIRPCNRNQRSLRIRPVTPAEAYLRVDLVDIDGVAPRLQLGGSRPIGVKVLLIGVRRAEGASLGIDWERRVSASHRVDVVGVVEKARVFPGPTPSDPGVRSAGEMPARLVRVLPGRRQQERDVDPAGQIRRRCDAPWHPAYAMTHWLPPPAG